MECNPVPLGNSPKKFLKNPKIELPYDSAISQLNIFPQRIFEHLYLSYPTEVYYSTSYNRQSNQECSSKDEQKTFSIYVHTHNSWMLFSWINNRLWQPEITVRNEISQTHKCYMVCQVWKSLGIKNRLESCKDCLRRVRREEEGNRRRNWVWRRSQRLIYRYETTIQIREYCNTVSYLIL